MSTVFHNILRAVASAMEVPVVVCLLLALAFAAFSIGWVLTERLGERRHLSVSLPALLDRLRSGEEPIPDCIGHSGLLRRQKDALLELTRHPGFTPAMRESLAANLLEQEQSHYDRILKATDLAAKLSPMFGLLGTLIPLGPGIIALGRGDTTIAGLIAAAVCLCISTVRRRWYSGYMADLETLLDCVTEMEREA